MISRSGVVISTTNCYFRVYFTLLLNRVALDLTFQIRPGSDLAMQFRPWIDIVKLYMTYVSKKQLDRDEQTTKHHVNHQ